MIVQIPKISARRTTLASWETGLKTSVTQAMLSRKTKQKYFTCKVMSAGEHRPLLSGSSSSSEQQKSRKEVNVKQLNVLWKVLSCHLTRYRKRSGM